MFKPFFLLYQALVSPFFLLSVIFLSFIVKIYFLTILIPHGLHKTTVKKPWFFLICTLAGSMFGDIAWGVKLVREIWIPLSTYAPVTFIIRISWAFLILQYQSLAFFIQSLTEKNFTPNRLHRTLLLISFGFVTYFLYIAFFDTGLIDERARELAKQKTMHPPLEIAMMRYVIFYLLNILVIPCLYFTFKKIQSDVLPKILRKQLKIFIQYLLYPYLVVEFLQAIYFSFKGIHAYLYPTVSISTLLLIYATYYCMKRAMGLRFLNISSHVEYYSKTNIIDNFKRTLEQLSLVTSVHELGHITQNFFKEVFNIPLRNVSLYMRSIQTDISEKNTVQKTQTLVENFLTTHDQTICECIQSSQILIYDEIAFNNFYEQTPISTALLVFLETINADIFIPLYKKNTMIAYIIIDKDSRMHDCYTKIERDEMLIFSSYLTSTITLLKNKNIEGIILQKKDRHDAIYQKHQEINLYKESIQSFLHTNKQKQIGIIFYKNNRFVLGNQAAKELIKINLNVQEGHSLAKTLKSIATQVETYKTPQRCLAKDEKENTLVIAGVPHLERNTVIIMISYPDITDIIEKQYDYLADPNQWDYLLYLETTKAGQLINQLIPDSGETLLNFKIKLLKTITNQKPLFLDVPDDDLKAFVELIHHISMRETLYTLNIKKPSTNFDIAIKLFGINPILGITTNNETPLLDKLNNVGTLFIQNIHFLSHETQEYLAEFIQFGFYRAFKCEQKVESNVHLICSTDQDLSYLAQEKHLSQKLYTALKNNTIMMPSLITLPDIELEHLINGFAEQALKTNTLKNLLTLTKKDKKQFILRRPQSLQELKTKVHHLLIAKTKKNNIETDTEFNPAYEIHNPELIEAAQLGKQALKDRRIMTQLWNKFKSQNQIATFLGVNRSSVNRRCKEYNLV